MTRFFRPGWVLAAVVVGMLAWGAFREKPAPDPMVDAEKPHDCGREDCEICEASRKRTRIDWSIPLGEPFLDRASRSGKNDFLR